MESPDFRNKNSCISILFGLAFCVTPVTATKYDVDISQGLGRRFDGIGGLSGGGATSKLLVNYAEPFRSQILDYLFKPNFAASLQILKVEIGGDAQSTDGTESSHMHEPWDEAYDRGYEWWLMVQAKKRNPAIKLYGLPWAFPGWLGRETPYGNPYNTATYILKWVAGAKKHYNLDIDYLGIWNERNYNITYVKVLRDVLNKNGFSNIKLVVGDGGWTVSLDILKDEVFSQAVDYIGAHYPGTNTVISTLQTGKQLWASEDYSTFNDNVGAGCWARLLNQNYVNGFMTSTISWNLIASYYEALPFGRDGLMTAEEPWSGHYVVQAPIWITAHTTQFASPGWYYLRHGAGVGRLMNGGSYVSLVDPEKSQFTMVIETMSHEHSLCIRPKLPAYNTSNQTVTFQFKGHLATLSKLYVWYSRLDFTGNSDILFKPLDPIQVNNGSFTLRLGVDEMYTVTTVYRPPPKLYAPSPPSQPFPVPYQDNFESYAVNSEAYNFAPQAGVWEVRESGDKDHGKVNQQVVLDKPCYWCDTGASPVNIGGNHAWTDITIEMDVRVPSVNGSDGVFLAGRVSKGGCGVTDTQGLFYSMRPGSKEFRLTSDLQLSNIIISGSMNTSFAYDHWYNMKLIVWGDTAYGFLDGSQLFMNQVPVLTQGFVAYGCGSYGLTDFDNLQILPG